ncbi:ubiquitin carboxyl-terminal hydrolase 10-B isoform X3 [Homalodisca vitripennis]|uniref:ubiquitin carboxyl-terminal hydrolase 10-B isoform X3 n=1 Tax=Homalodisca vitripennis TaxID=197043 RepID=UPI001EEBE10E|nr:ubiquitin carboxyl-terminal hydrolase 10-B isoform X3 [Homalodisca vitripennis]
MDKLQFLDLTDLNPGEEEHLANLLYNVDYSEVVELPPETPPSWAHHPVPYLVLEPEPVNVQEQVEGEPQIDYTAGSHMIPQSIQYTQMIPAQSVYVSNVTANVNVHGVGFVPAQTIGYPAPVSYISPVDTARKPRPSKTPTKRSPEVRRGLESPQANFSPTFNHQSLPPSIAPPMAYQYYPLPYPMPPHPLQQPLPRQFVYPGAGTVFSAFPPQSVFPSPHHVPQPPSEPREGNAVPYLEQEEKIEQEQPIYQQQASEEEEPPVVDTVIVENSNLQQVAEDIVAVIEVQVEETKIEKPLATKAPPANAFKSAPNLMQKPPFPPSTSRQKRLPTDNGPKAVEPPMDTGPQRKSFASLFGSGDKNSSPVSQSDSAASKPLAKIHPTVHNNISNVIGIGENCVEKTSTSAVQEYLPNTAYSIPVKVRPEKMILPDHDINMQRLGEFLATYQLDHERLCLQPRGLTNRSNYCYINAILQALVACPPFYNLMKAIPPTQENKGSKSRTPITDSMVKFVNEFSLMSMNARPVGRKEKAQATKEGGPSEIVTGPAFEPTYIYNMLKVMHAAFPVEGRQEDAEEFLSCLLNGLNDEMLEAMKLAEPQTNGISNGEVTTNGDATTNGNHDGFEQDHEWTEVINKNNKSAVLRRADFGRTPLSAIFRGQMRSRFTRANATTTTGNVQPFFTLQLDIEKADSVDRALELLVGKEEVVGGVCPKTNEEVSITTQTSLEELPIILLLHLKCFDYKLHTCSKITKTVVFPVDLKIDLKLLTSKSKTSNKDRQYKLLAVVYHDGKEATKGHYITDVFHKEYSWVRYDDSSVRSVTQHQVLNPKPPRVPYLLYYRRCDTIGAQDKNR